MIARLVSGLGFGLAVAIFWGPVVESQTVAAVPMAAQAGLHVSGNRLVDGAGNLVELHGVDISGTEFACAQGGTPGSAGWGISGDQPLDTPSTIAAIKSWHVNAVRVPLNEDCWLGINGINSKYGGAAYRAAIAKFVRDLNTSGMYVIVDLHWSAPGTAVARSQQPMADEDHGPTFWSSVAATFAADPSVVFDLYNEPFLYGSYMQNIKQDAWACWLEGCGLNQYLSGGQPYTKKYGWQTAGMQQLIDVVRASGATNVVIANGLDWANDDSGWLAHRPHDPAGNLVAGWHEYVGEACASTTCWSKNIAPIALSVPVVTGETGDHTGKGCTLLNLPTFLPWADVHGISYLAWTFNPWGYTHDVLITDWNGTPSSCEGQYYSAHLAALALSPVAIESPPPAKAAVARPAQTTIAGTGSRGIRIAILVIGMTVFVVGLLLASGRGRMLPIGEARGRAPQRMMRLMREQNVTVGLAIALCGAILLLSAALELRLTFPNS